MHYEYRIEVRTERPGKPIPTFGSESIYYSNLETLTQYFFTVYAVDKCGQKSVTAVKAFTSS